MSGYGRYPPGPPGSFPPPPGVQQPTGRTGSTVGAGTSGTGGFAALPAYGGPPSTGSQGQPDVAFRQPGVGAVGFGGTSSGTYHAPPPPHQQAAGVGMYGASPPGPGATNASASGITSSLSRMGVGSSPYGAPPAPTAPPAAQPHGHIMPLVSSSPFYQAPPSQVKLQRFVGASGTSIVPPPVAGHDPFAASHAAPPGGPYGYPQPPQPVQFEQQPAPTPLMGGQFHPGGTRPLATQPPVPVPTTSATPSTGATPGTSAQTFMEETVDWSITHPTQMLQFTTSSIPQSAQLSSSSKVVLGGILRPLSPMSTEIPIIPPGPAGIVRCKKCRTYINAFVSWYENGRRWRCNICGQTNDCPSAYFCHLDPVTTARRDKYDRPEFCCSVVEYLAPSEYMVRPPQPPAYFFALDVSAQAVASGMLAHVATGHQGGLGR